MRTPKLNRNGRLLVGLLGPAIIGSFIIMVFIFVSAALKEGPSIEMFQSVLKGFVLFLVAGSIFIGLQSLVYTIVMEFIFRPKVRLRNSYLAGSCMLGAASGAIVGMIIDDLPFFTISGTITGLVIGLVLYDKDIQSSHGKLLQSDAAEPRR